jgi:transposase
MWVLLRPPQFGGANHASNYGYRSRHGEVSFQVYGVDAAGQVVIRRQLKRHYVLAFFQKLPPCLVGIEACASSHHWSRELKALGHTVRLMPPAYVKPYVKRQKNDAAHLLFDEARILDGERPADARMFCDRLARLLRRGLGKISA